VWIHNDSRTMAMEVGIRSKVCNNLPAESTGSENGRCLSHPPIVRQRVRDYKQIGFAE
jgi:hypothetical protein